MARAVADLRSFPRWVHALLLASGGGVLLGVLGPFGSYANGGAMVRIVYWVASMWLGLVLYGAAVAASAKFAPSNRAVWPALIASVLVASLPQTLLTRTLAFRLWPELAGLGLSFATWYAQVVAVASVAVLGSAAVMRLLPNRPSASPRSAPEQPSRSLGSDVLALQMEDHYVRVHTSGGSDLILMPLGRAIEAVSAIDGLRTHRSWWVARRAVERVDGSPRSMNLHLRNAVVAPVSRNAVAALRAAGWLEGDPSL